MPSSADKVLQYLEEAHALEASLATTLSAHIAMTPRSAYRALLERHREETRAQVARIEQRLGELGQSQSLAHTVYGAAQTAIGQGTALALGPLSVLRGTGGEEKLLKNAKDEVSSEALEIATYDALEAVAEEVGDSKTAVLAREHRTQEEIFLNELRQAIPQLARDVIDAEVKGEARFDVSTIGAADDARSFAGRAREAANSAAASARSAISRGAVDVEERVNAAADAIEGRVDAAAEEVGARVEGAADEAAAAASQAAETAQRKVQSAADRAETTVDRTADRVAGQAEGGIADAAAATKRTAAKANASTKRTAAKASGETKRTAAKAATKAKAGAKDATGEAKRGAAKSAAQTKRAADRAASETQAAAATPADGTTATGAASGAGEPDGFPIAGYDTLTASQVVKQLGGLDTEGLAMVDGHERGGKARKQVLDRVAALRTRKVEEQLEQLP